MQFQLFSTPGSELESAVRSLLRGQAFLKFLSANDVGATGSHQAGLYLPRESAPLFLGGRTVEKGENLDQEILIDFQGTSLPAMFKWYGRAKSECRLTRLLPLFGADPARLVGSLLILLPVPAEEDGLFSVPDGVLQRFQCWIFEKEEEIEMILDVLGITPAETNGLLRFDLSERLRPECEDFAASVPRGFPSGEAIAARSRHIYDRLYGALEEDADAMLLRLIEIEYSLFRYFERLFYGSRIEKGFTGIEDFLSLSLEIHNRRKSRAGQSLELHLRYIFDRFHIACSSGPTTSDNRRPDFLFPSLEAYEAHLRRGGDRSEREFQKGEVVREESAPPVFFLAAKTTCKDRWRQILPEVRGLSTRYLFTLQQAVSSAQLREMEKEGVKVVLPESYRKRFPEEDRNRTMSLEDFLELLKKGGCQREDLFSSIRMSR